MVNPHHDIFRPTRGSCSKTFNNLPYRSKIEISALDCEAKSGMFQLSLNPSLFGVKNLGYLRTVVVKTVGLHVPFIIVMKCSPEVTLEQGRLDTLRYPTYTHNHHILKRQLL
jgi:hypothetical protein